MSKLLLNPISCAGFTLHHAQTPILLPVNFPHCELPKRIIVRMGAKNKVNKDNLTIIREAFAVTQQLSRSQPAPLL